MLVSTDQSKVSMNEQFTIQEVKMQQTTDNQYFNLLEELNRIPVIVPALAKKQYAVKQEKQMLYDDLIAENGEATW